MADSSSPNSPANNRSVVRTILLQATHEHHKQLNRHPMLAGLIQPECPLQEYLQLLYAYFGLYEALEKQILNFLSTNAADFDYQPRLKLPWLLQDMTYFQIAPHLPSRTTIVSPVIKNLGDLVGMLYVIEGSTLGGQLISKHLTKKHGITPETGGRFFGGYGENTSALWLDFLNFSASLNDDDAQCLSAKNMACETFRVFLQTLDNYSA